MGEPSEPEFARTRLAYVAKNYHNARKLTVLVVDGSSGVFDRQLKPVPSNE